MLMQINKWVYLGISGRILGISGFLQGSTKRLLGNAMRILCSTRAISFFSKNKEAPFSFILTNKYPIVLEYS